LKVKKTVNRKEFFKLTVNPRDGGYSFIELMIVILVSALLFGIGYASYRSFAQKQALIKVARAFEADVRVAQNKAMSAQVPEKCGTLSGYGLKFGGSSYEISSYCSGSGGESITRTFSGYVFSNNLGADSIVFKVLGQGTDLTGDMTVTITNSTTDKTVQVFILKSGEASIL